MTRGEKRLVVGIGSAHGDDQSGWQVIDSLSKLTPSIVELRKASVPHDLIDWLVDCDVLFVVDGCTTDDAKFSPRRFDVVNSPRVGVELKESPSVVTDSTASLRKPQLRSGSSHQIDLISVLMLASHLNQLPKKVVLWTVPGRCFGPGETTSPECQSAVALCADQISEELCDA